MISHVPPPQELNSEAMMHEHHHQIRSKPFLRRWYREMYTLFIAAAHDVRALPGQILELGSGGGFLKECLPDVITSDVLQIPGIDQVISADRLPFPNAGLKAIFAMNMLHHLTDPESFFREADRALTLGGRLVLIEPHASWWGSFIYSHMHYEAFDANVTEWKQKDSGRLATANNALPSLIFGRDRQRFESLFPRLTIRQITYHTVLRYLLSGGVSSYAFVPAFTYPLFTALDNILSRASTVCPMFQTLLLEKTS